MHIHTTPPFVEFHTNVWSLQGNFHTSDTQTKYNYYLHPGCGLHGNGFHALNRTHAFLEQEVYSLIPLFAKLILYSFEVSVLETSFGGGKSGICSPVLGSRLEKGVPDCLITFSLPHRQLAPLKQKVQFKRGFKSISQKKASISRTMFGP